MKLIIGGYAQGKLRVACQSVPEKKKIIWDGTLWESSVGNGLQRLFQLYPACIIIGDEIGNGIVPIDAFERKYRETYGRILSNIAERAEEVDRVLCGLSQKIK